MSDKVVVKGNVTVEAVEYNGWKNNIRITNGDVELIVTKDVGPRVLRFGYIGKRNMFQEIADQQGRAGEKQWMIRGGHRFWIAPEEKPKTYELDNTPIEIQELPSGIRTIQPIGSLSGFRKEIEISLSKRKNEVKVVHKMTNMAGKPSTVAPWVMSVMAQKGMAIIPQAKFIPHTKRLTHTHEWSLWGYTDLADPRWTIGSKYIFLRQDPKRAPNKLGILLREGWCAYLLDGFLFTKKFKCIEGATYPDGNVNFETFTNEDFLELETLGPLQTVQRGETVVHTEEWALHTGIKAIKTEADVDKYVLPLIR